MKKPLYLLAAIILFACKSNPNKSVENTKNSNDDIVNEQHLPSTMGRDYAASMESFKKTVEYLASDELRGRETGTEGIEKAAQYLEKDLAAFGIKPFYDTYRDDFKVNDLDAFNIVGVVEGNDQDLKKEFVLIGAHYDHIGIVNSEGDDKIANGANDNATGTATILELARYFSNSKSNKRSLIFAFFSAEEKGLRGSRHLAKRLKEEDVNLYAMINFEMTGVPFVDRDYTAFITGYELSNMGEIFNTYAGETVFGKSDVAAKFNLFRRSDNYAFYEEMGIPSQTISTCDLSNFDHYHKVGDEADIMDYDHMVNLHNKLVPVIEALSNSSSQEIKFYED